MVDLLTKPIMRKEFRATLAEVELREPATRLDDGVQGGGV
jgi:hypothetical protein